MDGNQDDNGLDRSTSPALDGGYVAMEFKRLCVEYVRFSEANDILKGHIRGLSYKPND